MYPNMKKQRLVLSPFLRLLHPYLQILRCLALFPANSSAKHVSNVFFYIVIATLGILNLYFMTYKFFSGLAQLFSSRSATSISLVAIFLWCYLNLMSVTFCARIGHKRILEHFNELLLFATKQRALESRFPIVRKKITFMAALATPMVLSITALLPTLCFTEIGNSWPAAKSLQTLLFFDYWYVNIFLSVVMFYNALTNGVWILFYVTLCECLKEEFNFINEEIAKMNIRDQEVFKKVALKHSRLLKCLNYLHAFLSFYVFISFSILTIILIIFAYLVMVDVPISFRLLAGFWVIASALNTLIFCNSAESLHSSVSDLFLIGSVFTCYPVLFNIPNAIYCLLGKFSKETLKIISRIKLRTFGMYSIIEYDIWPDCNFIWALTIALKEAMEAKTIVCSKMAQEHLNCSLDDVTVKTANIIIHQASIDVQITALGFFAVSKETLLAIWSFVATYVVIMLQSPNGVIEQSSTAVIHDDNITSLIHGSN